MKQVLEGTWKDVSQEASTLQANTRVRLEVLESKPSRMIRFGILKPTREITEEDFESAKFNSAKWSDKK